MNLAGLLFVAVIQCAAFLAPLFLAFQGLLSGDAAGLVAIVSWFCVGLPISYAAFDRATTLRTARASARKRFAPLTSPGPAL